MTRIELLLFPVRGRVISGAAVIVVAAATAAARTVQSARTTADKRERRLPATMRGCVAHRKFFHRAAAVIRTTVMV